MLYQASPTNKGHAQFSKIYWAGTMLQMEGRMSERKAGRKGGREEALHQVLFIILLSPSLTLLEDCNYFTDNFIYQETKAQRV